MGKTRRGKTRRRLLAAWSLRSLVSRAPLVFMLFALISLLAAHSFVVDFDLDALPFSVEFAWFDPTWLTLLFALLLLLVLLALVLLVKPASFLKGEWFAGFTVSSVKKTVLLVLLGAAVPCIVGLLALASPLFVGSDSVVALSFGSPDSSSVSPFGASGSSASEPVFGAPSAASPSFAATGALFSEPHGFPIQISASLVLCAVATCAFTALFEEMLFRGVVIPCVIAETHQAAFAVRAGALLFAAAHVELAFPCAGPLPAALVQSSTWILLGQFVLKPIQAAFFGFCMGSLYCAARSVKLPVLVHFLFDLLYFAPSLLSAGAFPSTYMSGNLLDLVLLSASVFFLAAAALRLPRSKTRQDETGRAASSGRRFSIAHEEDPLENRTEQTR